jgi:hypothetical protein
MEFIYNFFGKSVRLLNEHGAPICGFGNYWKSIWSNICIELYSKGLSIDNASTLCRLQGWEKKKVKTIKWWPRWNSRWDPKNRHMRVDSNGIMSWIIWLCEHLLSSRHHLYEERRNDLRIDQVEVHVQDEHVEEIMYLNLAVIWILFYCSYISLIQAQVHKNGFRMKIFVFLFLEVLPAHLF